MPRPVILYGVLTLLMTTSLQLAAATRAENIVETIHGETVRDPYRWLEDEKSPEVQKWMDEQNAAARKVLDALPGRSELDARLKKLLYIEDVSAPQRYGSRYFYTRRHANKEKSIVYWKEGKDGAEKVLFDPNTWSADGSTALGQYEPDEQGRNVVFSVRENNSDEATMYLMDIASGERSKIDVIHGAKYASPSWLPDGSGFYYTWLPVDPKIPVAERPGYAEVRFHKIGTPPETDVTIRPKTGSAQTFQGAYVSRNGRWLIHTVQHGWNSTDVWFKDRTDEKSDWTPLIVGTPFTYSVDVFENTFYIHTNWDAPRYRVFKADPAKPARENWTEIIPQRENATLDGVGIVGGKLSVRYLVNAATTLEICDLNGKLDHAVTLPSAGSAWGLYGRQEDDEAYFIFTSYLVPRQVYVTSVKTGETKLWSKLDLDVDPTPYLVEQVWYPSKDGTQISLFIVRRKDMKFDGSNPTLLYGYGGFNVSLTPGFSSGLVPWLESGGVYAVANLRGGGEYGEEWHKAGMGAKKQNTFDDFAAAAEYLIAKKITSPEKLAIEGGSNGGLLVGALMTQRPELFKAVICAVPLLDMVRYHKFGSGKTWIPEYGSAEDPAQFKTLIAYSPYHNVKPGVKYPALLMLAADSDDRVDPCHARKFVAQVQSVNTQTPALLQIERNAGHGGADKVQAMVEKNVDRWSFLWNQLGVKK
jgi:prolyl oligopeptidase